MRFQPSVVFICVSVVACERPPADAPARAKSDIVTPAPAEPSTTASAAVVARTVDAGPARAGSEPAHLVAQASPLPGTNGPVSLDYIFYERVPSRVWVPAGTGSVDVLDVASGGFTRIDGFKTEEREGHGKKRIVGPSAGSMGNGFAYIGNRATSEVCPIDVKTLKTGKCVRLPSGTDGVVYVASSKEVWVTLPGAQTLAVLDASKPDSLRPKATIKVDGAPEGYAVDDGHGVFFTNLEDKGKTVAIEIRTNKIKSTWDPGCGPDGPRGVAFDAAHDFVIVACTDHVQVLDAAHDGAPKGRLDTGAGVDNIDYVDGTHLLYVAASKAARLTVARVDDKGQFTVVATGDTAEGARNVVADANGNAYVADAPRGRLLVFKPAASAR